MLPLVPAYLAFLGGVTSEGRAPSHVVSAALAFVIGFTAVFVALGASATLIGRALADEFTLLSRISGIIIIIFGVHYTGLINLPFLNYEARFHPLMKRSGVLSALLIGLAFAFGWTPCVGPVLGSVLLLASRSGSVLHGIALLFFYGLGLGVPFLLAAAAFGPFNRLFSAIKGWVRPIEIAMGSVMIATGALVFADTISSVSAWLLRIFPALSGVG